MASNSFEEIQTFCETHTNKLLQFICLDPMCSKSTRACVLCVKNDHSKCKDDFIILTREMDEKVDLIKSESDSTKITHKLNEILELKLYELNKTLNSKKQWFMKALKFGQNVQELMAPGVLENVKKNFNVEYDQAGDRIRISSKFDMENDKLEQSYRGFEKSLEAKILKFIKDFEKIKFSVKGKINSEDWIMHKNILIEDDNGQLAFSRAKEDSSFNYFCGLYTVPLDSPCKFKMTIQTIYESDRFLDFGIVTKSKYDSTESGGFINTFGSGAISYCGYSNTGGINGKSLTSGSTDSTGYKPGDYCIMDYVPGESIRFYNEEETLDMSKTMTGDTETYYLFIVVYHPQTTCTLEILN